jgi:LPXTG-motif cell wall-anchored protein
MPVAAFALLTVAGSAIWNLALIGAGWALGDNWERVTRWFEQADAFLLAGALIAAAAWFALRRRKKLHEQRH